MARYTVRQQERDSEDFDSGFDNREWYLTLKMYRNSVAYGERWFRCADGLEGEKPEHADDPGYRAMMQQRLEKDRAKLAEWEAFISEDR